MTNPTNQWQDISSAPKDGTVVMVWCKNSLWPVAAQKYDGGEWRFAFNQERCQPTHWMPKPEPPSAAKESEVCDFCGGEVVPPRRGRCGPCETKYGPKDPAADTEYGVAVEIADQSHNENWGGEHREGFCPSCALTYLAAQHTADKLETKTERLERIEVAAKAALPIFDNALDCMGDYATKDRWDTYHNLRAALTSNEGER